MLTFLTGVNPDVKRKKIYEKINSLIDRKRKVWLIVPEQSAFEREREFLFVFGEKRSDSLKVSSFSHFSEDILNQCGIPVKPRSDNNARAVLMSLALRDNADALNIYDKFYGRSESINKLLSMYDEIRQAGLSPEKLFEAGKGLDGLIKEKTSELAEVFSGFEALLTERFSEPSDNLKKAGEALKSSEFYNDAVFFFDGFRGFTGEQINFLSELLKKAPEVFVSVTAPSLVNNGLSEAFSHSIRNAENIKQNAKKYSVRIFEENTDSKNLAGTPLNALKNSIFSVNADVFDAECDNVKIIRAADVFEECELAAVEIKRLLEKGLRCREIAVVERGATYTPILTSQLKKSGIPVFEDKRLPLYEYPLVRLILSAVDIASGGFDTQKIFGCIKTGLCGVSADECSELENYVFAYSVDREMWLGDFKGNPDGFGVQFGDEAKSSLAQINGIRRRVIEPLLELKKQLKKNNAENDCRAVFMYLKSVNAANSFLEYARFLNDGGNEAEAVQCGRVWDECMSALDSLNAALGKREISASEFSSLLRLMLCTGSIGDIPAGIDEVIIGSADRVRFMSPKAAVVLGVNGGIFPQGASFGGLLTPAEKRLLAQNGFVLEKLPENEYAEERLIAFDTLTCPSDELILLYSDRAVTGEKLDKSEIITETERILPKVRHFSAENYNITDCISTPQTAFEKFAALTDSDANVRASLRAALENNGDFSAKLKALERAVKGVPAAFADENIAKELFGENLYSSASKTEKYNKCPFSYFCCYGMGVSKPQAVELDARINGLLVHKALEDILKTYTNAQLLNMDEAEIKKQVKLAVDSYVEEYMGGKASLKPGVLRDINRSEITVNTILHRFISEFASSGFVTFKTELKIGGSDADIPAYKLSLPDGGSITVTGSIDRVDTLKNGNENYVRVIDYKTGGKDFKLSDVFDGLNMQMLIYLFALCKNGKKKYGELLPAGILYVPAKSGGESVDRNASSEEIDAQKIKNGRMNGLLLQNEDVLRGMEANAEGIYVDAKIDKNGNLKGSFLSLAEFELLHKRIDDILIKNGTDIHKGFIPALPIEIPGDSDLCESCDYSGVCLHENDGVYKEIQRLKHEKAREILNGGENQ